VPMCLKRKKYEDHFSNNNPPGDEYGFCTGAGKVQN
jgi:hypothetical protein